VQERPAHVQALPAGACEHESCDQTDDGAAEGDNEDEAAVHVARIDQPVDRRPDNPDGEQSERDAVRLRREDLETGVPERPAAGGRSRRHRRGDKCESERCCIGEHVPRVREERE
jgi:hypothetical protein